MHITPFITGFLTLLVVTNGQVYNQAIARLILCLLSIGLTLYFFNKVSREFKIAYTLLTLAVLANAIFTTHNLSSFKQSQLNFNQRAEQLQHQNP